MNARRCAQDLDPKLYLPTPSTRVDYSDDTEPAPTSAFRHGYSLCTTAESLFRHRENLSHDADYADRIGRDLYA